MSKKARDPNRPRITVDAEDVAATGAPSLIDVMADAAAEQAWPGVFSAGKTITETSAYKDGDVKVLRFGFSDGSQMNVVGQFEVRYVQSGPDHPVVEQQRIQQGRELMTGEPQEE